MSGIPELVGPYTFRVRVRDAVGNIDLNTIRLEVRSDGRLVVTPESLVGAERGRVYVAPLRATGGRRPLAWSVEGELPPGLLLGEPEADDPEQAEADAVIRGAPTSSGVWGVTITVTDDRGRTASRPYAVVVQEPPPPFTDDGCRCVRARPTSALAWLWFGILVGLWRRR